MLEQTGSQDVRKSVHIHMHFGLFADVLEQIAATVSSIPQDDVSYEHLKRAVRALLKRLKSIDGATRATRGLARHSEITHLGMRHRFIDPTTRMIGPAAGYREGVTDGRLDDPTSDNVMPALNSPTTTSAVAARPARCPADAASTAR